MGEYVKPMMNSEVFMANEYISACGDSGTTYKFTCDAGSGVPGSVYLETNGEDGLQIRRDGGDTYLSDYRACGTTHEADSDDAFLEGYYVTGNWWSQQVTKVIVWRGPNNDNTHCTTNLDQESWETGKS